jgi:hypothetical protein
MRIILKEREKKLTLKQLRLKGVRFARPFGSKQRGRFVPR